MSVLATNPTAADATLVMTAMVPMDRHPAAVYLARLAPGSRRTMRGSLDTVASILTGGRADAMSVDWAKVRYSHTQAIRTLLAESYAPATANKMLSALRGVLRESWRLGGMSSEDFSRASDLDSVRGERLPRGRALGPGELAALMGACAADAGPAGARDAALLAVLYAGGLRRSEAVALNVEDYEPETGLLTIRAGKGNKDRTCYATNGSSLALADWLAVRGHQPGALFVGIDKAGRLSERRLSGQAIQVMLQKRARQAGVARLSPHDMRRSFISHLLDAGADISVVSKLAGHTNVGTTSRYDRRPEEAKRAAAELLHLPYSGRPTAKA
jgi:site-specific recombinase XerD